MATASASIRSACSPSRSRISRRCASAPICRWCSSWRPRGQPFDFTLAGDQRSYLDLMSDAGLQEIATYADAIGPHKWMVVQFADGKAHGHRARAPRARARDSAFTSGRCAPRTNSCRLILRSVRRRRGAGATCTAEIHALLDAGITGFFSDHPDLAVRARDDWWGRSRSHAATISSRHPGPLAERRARLLRRACSAAPKGAAARNGWTSISSATSWWRTSIRTSKQHVHHNEVDGHDVPVPHFGVVLEWQAWQALAERLRSAGTRFEIEPGIRFAGQVGEQATMFLYDPSGNALEFKAFKDPVAAVCEVAAGASRGARAAPGSPASPSRRSRKFAGVAELQPLEIGCVRRRAAASNSARAIVRRRAAQCRRCFPSASAARAPVRFPRA